jgi:hypothetical protein
MESQNAIDIKMLLTEHVVKFFLLKIITLRMFKKMPIEQITDEIQP